MGRGLFLGMIFCAASLSAAPNLVFDWSIRGSTTTNLNPDVEHIPHPGHDIADATHLQNQNVWLTADATDRVVGLMLQNDTAPLDGARSYALGDSLDWMSANSVELDYVFSDVEVGTAQNLATMVNLVTNHPDPDINRSRLVQYAYFPGEVDESAHFPWITNRVAKHQAYMTSGVNVANPNCYPYEYFEMHATLGKWGSYQCPNTRSALFWAPLERYSTAKRNLPEGHQLIPFIAGFIPWDGYNAPEPTEGDRRALLQHMRLRGSDGYYRLVSWVTGLSDAAHRAEMLDAWHDLDGFFAEPGAAEILTLDTDKTSGVNWSAMRKGQWTRVLISNLSAADATVDFPPEIPELPDFSPSVPAGSHVFFDYPVTGVFYPLTVNSGAGGGSYVEGAVVPVSADAPPAGHAFDAWTGDTSTMSDANAATTTVTMPAAAVSVAATYVASPTHPLTVNSGTGDGSYVEGAVVPISADAPPAGQAFDVWTGDTATLADANAANTTLTIPASAVSVTATYVAAPTYYPLTVIGGSGDGDHIAGTGIGITADAPPAGYSFNAWLGDIGTVADATAAATTIVMPQANATLTASYIDGAEDVVAMPDTSKYVITSHSEKYWVEMFDDDVFNGAGLSSAGTHNNINADMWSSTSLEFSNATRWIKVDLGGTNSLDHLRVWAQNQQTWTGRSIQTGSIYVALTDPGQNVDQSTADFDATGWTPVVEDYIFAPGGDGAGPITNTDPRIEMGGVDAAFLAIVARSGHNASDGYRGLKHVGLSEVQVYASVNADVVDADGDGLPTDWEQANGLDPNDDGTVDPDQGAAGDPDLDGATNREEWIADTHPNDSNSLFMITGTASDPDGSVDVNLNTSAARAYLLHGTDDMSAPLPWPVLDGPTAGTGGAMTLNDAGAAGAVERAYAVEVRMP